MTTENHVPTVLEILASRAIREFDSVAKLIAAQFPPGEFDSQDGDYYLPGLCSDQAKYIEEEADSATYVFNDGSAIRITADGFEVIREEEAMDRVVMTNPCLGLVRMQVCVVEDATDDEILEVANRVNPSGTTNGWSVVLREEEPVRCEEYPERIHLLLEC